MSFFIYDITFLILFCIFIITLLYFKRNNTKREGLLFLYKSQFGIGLIKKMGEKYKKILFFLEYFVVFLGYVSMIIALYFLFQLVYMFFKFPEFIKAVKIPPIMPLIPYLPSIFKVDFLPPFYFTYWIIVLAITAIVHEFFHGIFAKINNIKIKSTGFAFLGPFVGAFVEPDENAIKKLKIKNQLSILSAGSFANWIVTVVFFFLMWLFFLIAFQPSGVIFNSYAFNIVNNSEIQEVIGEKYIEFDGGINLTEIKINNKTYFVKNLTASEQVIAFEDSPALRTSLNGVITEIDNEKIKDYKDLKTILLKKSAGQNITIKTFFNNTQKVYNITLTEKAGKPYLGIVLIKTDGFGFFSKIRNKFMFFKDPNTYYTAKKCEDLTIFTYNLIWWIVFVNLSVAIINMLPLGIFDGGRIFYLSVRRFLSEKMAKQIFAFITYLIIFVFVFLTIRWFFL
ncbi:MAG: site-2 protease family protein [Candidatus Pacearchaeota archaeon]